VIKMGFFGEIEDIWAIALIISIIICGLALSGHLNQLIEMRKQRKSIIKEVRVSTSSPVFIESEKTGKRGQVREIKVAGVDSNGNRIVEIEWMDGYKERCYHYQLQPDRPEDAICNKPSTWKLINGDPIINAKEENRRLKMQIAHLNEELESLSQDYNNRLGKIGDTIKMFRGKTSAYVPQYGHPLATRLKGVPYYPSEEGGEVLE